MKKILYCLGLTLCLIVNTKAHAQNSVKIAAIVNGEIISNQDIQNRINSFLMTSQIPLNAQTKEMIAQKVLHGAIDEKIKLQAAEKEGIKIDDKDVKLAIKNFEKNNKIPEGELKNILKQANVSQKSFEEQMKADLAWIRLLKNKLRYEGNITQSEIEKALADAKKDLNTPKYNISEIFIKKEKAKDIQYLVDNLKKDPRFELYAMKFSDSPSAAKGGNLGWINQGQLPDKLEEVIYGLNNGEISNAIPMNDGYYVIRLNQKFDPKKDKPTLPSTEEIKNYLTNQKMERLAQKYLQDLRINSVIEIRN